MGGKKKDWTLVEVTKYITSQSGQMVCQRHVHYASRIYIDNSNCWGSG